MAENDGAYDENSDRRENEDGTGLFRSHLVEVRRVDVAAHWCGNTPTREGAIRVAEKLDGELSIDAVELSGEL